MLDWLSKASLEGVWFSNLSQHGSPWISVPPHAQGSVPQSRRYHSTLRGAPGPPPRLQRATLGQKPRFTHLCVRASAGLARAEGCLRAAGGKALGWHGLRGALVPGGRGLSPSRGPAAWAAPPGRAGLLRPAQLPLRARVTSAPAGTARRLRGAGPLPSGPRRGSAGAGARKCVPGSAAPLPLNPSFCLPVPASWNSRFQLPLVWAAGLSLFAGSLGPTVRG